ncbi:unnamed protein product [Soboliphyme baturini]|uniref:RNA polymerase II subunit B1 CTD phosphatase RPAP2 homolog n=1 Tax=Soboliphyme baturini TaxID=241478 RepID=A0A183IV25_9BILA|nr:unnamed protein product [Soboliphyme baturini]
MTAGKTPADWRTGVIVPVFKKGDHKECSIYRGITLLGLPGKVYAKVLERRCRGITDSKIQEEQCGFRPGRSASVCIFALRKMVENSWEYDRPMYECFVVQYLDTGSLTAIAEERALGKICGYLTCANLPDSRLTTKYAIRCHCVYELTERKWFCSDRCYSAYRSLLANLPEEPIWLRCKLPLHPICIPDPNLIEHVVPGEKVCFSEAMKNISKLNIGRRDSDKVASEPDTDDDPDGPWDAESEILSERNEPSESGDSDVAKDLTGEALSQMDHLSSNLDCTGLADSCVLNGQQGDIVLTASDCSDVPTFCDPAICISEPGTSVDMTAVAGTDVDLSDSSSPIRKKNAVKETSRQRTTLQYIRKKGVGLVSKPTIMLTDPKPLRTPTAEGSFVTADIANTSVDIQMWKNVKKRISEWFAAMCHWFIWVYIVAELASIYVLYHTLNIYMIERNLPFEFDINADQEMVSPKEVFCPSYSLDVVPTSSKSNRTPEDPLTIVAAFIDIGSF